MKKRQQKRPIWVRVKYVLTSLWASLSRSLKPGSRIWGHHVSSNLRRALVYFRLRHPARGTSSGGTTCLLCLALYVIMFIELCSNFMSLFTYLFLTWSVAFSPSCFLSELCNLVTDGLAWGIYILPGSLGYFYAWGPVLPNGCPLKKLMRRGVQSVQPA
jgi:hypothetical protein